MTAMYSVNFYCHGCGLENTFNFQCEGGHREAAFRASSFCCPSGCNPKQSVFELTHMIQVDWALAIEAAEATFH
jgi:hypothetical protein